MIVSRLILTLLLGALSCLAAEPVKKPAKVQLQPWGTWVEADFPFFSSILDARRDGLGKNNLTPRGIIIKLTHDTWACFDTDLLRVSAVWRGKGVSDKALAPGSYHDPSRKTLGGQFPARSLKANSGSATPSSPAGSSAPRSTAPTRAFPPLRRRKSAAVLSRRRSANSNPSNSSARTSSSPIASTMRLSASSGRLPSMTAKSSSNAISRSLPIRRTCSSSSEPATKGHPKN
ncbi:hypothetical protein EMGBS6_15110 [Opitutia bacterium]|nr:hypothetical protein EMGBS6_15110 [Opitutae bacterium]